MTDEPIAPGDYAAQLSAQFEALVALSTFLPPAVRLGMARALVEACVRTAIKLRLPAATILAAVDQQLETSAAREMIGQPRPSSPRAN